MILYSPLCFITDYRLIIAPMNDTEKPVVYELRTEYGGVDLELRFAPDSRASLRINGIERESASSDKQTITLMLSSTVQTDYEWHEFVEAVVRYDADHIKASIYANKQELVTRSIPRTTS